jgi:hypothetical protein
MKLTLVVTHLPHEKLLQPLASILGSPYVRLNNYTALFLAQLHMPFLTCVKLVGLQQPQEITKLVGGTTMQTPAHELLVGIDGFQLTESMALIVVLLIFQNQLQLLVLLSVHAQAIKSSSTALIPFGVQMEFARKKFVVKNGNQQLFMLLFLAVFRMITPAEKKPMQLAKLQMMIGLFVLMNNLMDYIKLAFQVAEQDFSSVMNRLKAVKMDISEDFSSHKKMLTGEPAVRLLGFEVGHQLMALAQLTAAHLLT